MCRTTSRTSCLRVRVRSRNSRIGAGGECRVPRRVALDHAPQLSQGDAGAQREGSEPLLLDPLPYSTSQIADTREWRKHKIRGARRARQV